jgi:hypothetical protein
MISDGMSRTTVAGIGATVGVAVMAAPSVVVVAVEAVDLVVVRL